MDKVPCFNHKEYKKGCKDCFEKNRDNETRSVWDDDNGEWIHDPEMGCR